jgi:hypothetical protein
VSRRRKREKQKRHRHARPSRTRTAAAAGLSLGTALAAPAAAEAADYTVDNDTDITVGIPCTPAPNDCSLRDAIGVADADPAADRILFQSGLSGTIALTGQIPFFYPLEILGPGAGTLAVDGNGNDRIFDIGAFAIIPVPDVLISGLTLTGGNASDDGGAIRSAGVDLTVADSVISGNDVSGIGQDPARGGGIAAEGGSLTVLRSDVSSNDAQGYFAGGAGIYADETNSLTITDSSISGNDAFGYAALGGGVGGYYAGPVTFTRSTVDGNEATGFGFGAAGGIGTNGSTPLAIDHSTVSGNESTLFGGGVYSFQESLFVESSTISGNNTGIDGGGINSDDGIVQLVNSTISGNEAGFPSSAGGGAFLCNCSSASIYNSILADNTADDGADLYLSGGPPPDSAFALVEAPIGGGALNETIAGSNLLGVDPQLADLSDNGGPTETQALPKSSPAVDKGFNFGATDDQRGAARPFDLPDVLNSTAASANGTDIGAFELGATPAAASPAARDLTCADKASAIISSGKVKGTPGPDVIFGSKKRDVIRGGGGNDLICGRAGNDRLLGGAGDDRIFGGPGNDVLIGGPGNDGLRGGKGKDVRKQ